MALWSVHARAQLHPFNWQVRQDDNRFSLDTKQTWRPNEERGHYTHPATGASDD